MFTGKKTQEAYLLHLHDHNFIKNRHHFLFTDFLYPVFFYFRPNSSSAPNQDAVSIGKHCWISISLICFKCLSSTLIFAKKYQNYFRSLVCNVGASSLMILISPDVRKVFNGAAFQQMSVTMAGTWSRFKRKYSTVHSEKGVLACSWWRNRWKCTKRLGWGSQWEGNDHVQVIM